MLQNRGCEYPICELEAELFRILNERTARFRKLVGGLPPLTTFFSPLDLITYLHGQVHDENQASLADQILGTLIQKAVSDSDQDFFQCVLILAFIPTMQRTCTCLV